MKNKKFVIFILIFSILCSVFLIACDDKDKTINVEPIVTINDDTYTIVIKGIMDADISITKAQIKSLFTTNPVVIDDSNPVFASDKTDDNGNKIPHTLKGVYLDDILATYIEEEVSCSKYGVITVDSNDGYNSSIPSNVFNIEQGGSKIILAFEYDDYVLNPQANSGAIRMVVPNQTMNSWAKQVKTLTFSSTPLTKPSVSKMTFLEALGSQYLGSFTKTEELGGMEKAVIYNGISLEKLIENDILANDENLTMAIYGWDYNSTSDTFSEYANYKSFDFYKNAFLVDTYQIEGEKVEKELRAPVFDGEAILSGMSVKNTLSLALGDNSLVCLEKCFLRFGKANATEIQLKDVLEYMEIYENNATYTILGDGSNQVMEGVIASDFENAKIVKTDLGYDLTMGEHIINNIFSIEKE